jgi:hypothetical protein
MKHFVSATLWFSVAQFVILLITGLFGITPIQETFFPTLGMVAFFGVWNAILRERQKKRDWVEANARHREAMLAGGKRASWPPKRPADAGGEFHVDVDMDRLRKTLFKTTGMGRTEMPVGDGYVDPAKGVNPTKPWPRSNPHRNEQFFDEQLGKRQTTRTPDQYSRRTDPKPADTVTVTPDPLPITSPAHPLHAQTYGSTFGNTNEDSYRAPCAPAPSSHSSSHSTYDSSPSYSCSSDSGSSSSSDSGSCGGGGGCD